jgi:hypothetical protein
MGKWKKLGNVKKNKAYNIRSIHVLYVRRISPLPQYIMNIRTQFWLSVQQTCPTLSTEPLKVLLPFSYSYICEVRFSAMLRIKTKFRNGLQLSNSLRLKITRIVVDVNSVINNNRKQSYQSRTPHYEKQIEFFVRLYSVINEIIFFLFRYFFVQ